MSSGTILTLAAACGLLVANIYYAQPLIAEIAQSLGLATGAAGLIVTMSQIGYGVGLLFVVPLGDLVENRRLILISVALSAVALACAAFAPSAGVFLTCAAVIGLGSVAVQILIPLAAHLAPDATRGRVVGMVSSGLDDRHHAGASCFELHRRAVIMARGVRALGRGDGDARRHPFAFVADPHAANQNDLRRTRWARWSIW